MAELTVRPLSVVQQERAAFGLRSHDYPRYRKHCASKLHHLRQHLHATHGKGREYKKLPAVPLGKAQDGHVLIHLFEAERAFSHAQELLASKDSPEKHHAIARFRRALHHTSSLLGYLLRLPAQAQAELGAYSLMLRARYAIAKGDEELYNPALVQLATARLLLQALADAAGSSRDVALYTSFLDSTAPEVRFLAHSLGHPRAWDTQAACADVKPEESEGAWAGFARLAEQLERAREGRGQGELRELIWEGRAVQVREPELVELLIRVQSAQGALSAHSAEPQPAAKADADAGAGEVPKQGKGKPKPSAKNKKHRRTLLPAYDALLHALADAEDLARRLTEAQQQQGEGALLAGPPPGPGQGEGAEADVGFLWAFVTYRLLATRIERDLLLVQMLENPPRHFTGKPGRSSSAKPAQAASKVGKKPEPAEAGPDDRTCLAIIKSLDAVLQSLEQMRALPLAEESAGVAQGLEGRLEYTRAKRIGYLARLYASQNSYGEALALLSRGTIYLRALASSSSSSSLASPTPELAFYPLPVPLSDALGKQLAALELRLKKEWYAATRPKPVFYDVAFNYVKQPGERVRQRAGLPAELAAGVMGVVGSAAGAAGNAAAGAGKALAGAGTKAVGKVEAAAGVGEKRQQVEEEPVAGQQGQGQGQEKGWSGYLGGWWGRK